MGHGDPPIRHDDYQIPQAQFEAGVPAHAPNDDLSVEVQSFEQIFDRDEPLHLFIITRHPRVCTRARKTTREFWSNHENHRLPGARYNLNTQERHLIARRSMVESVDL